jgi:hypothetical protein
MALKGFGTYHFERFFRITFDLLSKYIIDKTFLLQVQERDGTERLWNSSIPISIRVLSVTFSTMASVILI